MEAEAGRQRQNGKDMKAEIEMQRHGERQGGRRTLAMERMEHGELA